MNKLLNRYLLNKYLFAAILLGLIVPSPAFGVFGIVDVLKKMLQGLEKITHPIGAVIMLTAFFYIGAIILLGASAWLLQFVIEAQTTWLRLGGNEIVDIVDAGFAFTSGLANMFLILILLAIAFAIILKIESLQAKKVLPRLIIVALLLNFSLVFMGMIIDISHILFRTILEAGGENLVSQIMGGLFGGVKGVFDSLVGWATTLAFSYIIPGASTFKQLSLVVGFIPIFGPNMMIWVSQLVVAFLMSAVLFLFTFLFAARVFVIQILAILSPLAFLCLILPQTKKMFDKWLKHFIAWVFLGLFLLFFLILGFKGFTILRPGIEIITTPIAPWFHIPDLIVSYTFLFIFLGIILWMSKTMIPEGAGAAIVAVKGLAVGTKKVFGATMGHAIVKQFRETAIQESSERKAAEEEGGKPLGIRQRLAGQALKPFRFAHRLAGTTPEAEMRKTVEQEAAEFEKQSGGDTDTLITASYGIGRPDPYNRAALLLAAFNIDGKKGIDKFIKEHGANAYHQAINTLGTVAPKKIKKIVAQDTSLITEPKKIGVEDVIKRAMFSDGYKTDTVKDEKTGEYIDQYRDPDLRQIKDSKIKIDGQEFDVLKGSKEGREKITERVLLKKAMEASTRKDVENISPRVMDDPKWIESAALHLPPHIQVEMAEKFGQVFVKKLQGTQLKLGINIVEQFNSGSLNLHRTPGGVRVGFKDIRPTTPTPTPTRTRTRPLNIKDKSIRERLEWREEEKEWYDPQTKTRYSEGGIIK